MMEFPRSIKDGDIELVKLEPTFENARRMFDLIDISRDVVGQFQTFVDNIHSPEDEFNALVNTYKPNVCYYVILYRGQPAGGIGLNTINQQNNFAKFGYWLGNQFVGCGIMSRALKMMEKLAFNQLNLNRLEISAAVDNDRSRALAERNGYVLDGITRQEIMLYGVYHDKVIYSKLKSEWEKENKNA